MVHLFTLHRNVPHAMPSLAGAIELLLILLATEADVEVAKGEKKY